MVDVDKTLLTLEVLVEDPNGDMQDFVNKLHKWGDNRRAIAIDRTQNDTWVVRFIIEEKQCGD